MCAQLGRAWGNERFGEVNPAEEVCLAAEQHEIGWETWELAPTLNKATGLPDTFETAAFSVLERRAEAAQRLATQNRYAALLVSLHYTSFFTPPSRLGRLRAKGGWIHSFLARSAEFEARLRATLDASEDEIERNRRLVRVWDSLSHDIILQPEPRVHRVPAAGGAQEELRLGRREPVYTIDPWPFGADRVVVRTEGRLLEGTFDDEESMRETLAHAPWVELSYELEPL